MANAADAEDEHKLRLAQATDGYWYAYIADKTDVLAAHNANIALGSEGNNLEFGYDVKTGSSAGASLAYAAFDENSTEASTYCS